MTAQEGRQGAFDWPALMRAGLRGLGLKPEEFWRLTPVELGLLLGEPTTARPMGRDRLAELLRQWPDAARKEE